MLYGTGFHKKKLKACMNHLFHFKVDLFLNGFCVQENRPKVTKVLSLVKKIVEHLPGVSLKKHFMVD